MIVANCTVAALVGMPAFPALIEEYGQESAIEGLPPPSARLDIYAALEERGMLHCLWAVEDRELAGFITIVAPTNPHYGKPIAVSESFFVAKRWRPSLAGLKLLVAAEDKARELGVPGLLVTAPMGSRLADLLPKMGFRETNRAFFKRVLHG